MAGDGEAALLKGLLLEKEGESIGPGTLEEGGRFNSRPTGARSRPGHTRRSGQYRSWSGTACINSRQACSSSKNGWMGVGCDPT